MYVLAGTLGPAVSPTIIAFELKIEARWSLANEVG
jgi:hypothetical protein